MKTGVVDVGGGLSGINGQNPLMKKARAYVDNWKETYRDNTEFD